MSDDPSPSSAAPVEDPVPHHGDEASRASAAEQLPESQQGRPRSNTNRRRRRKKKSSKKRNPGLVKKLQFLTHLLKTLDLVVFAELSSLYYMECSMFRFLLRGAPQYIYLTPKNESFPFLMPASRLHVGLVVLPSIVCMLLHIFASLPVGPDYSRGYQHGGVLTDFVGQKPPASKIYYVLVDIAILFLQCLMLTVHSEREKLRMALKTFRPFIAELFQETATARTIEELDAEERGVLRDDLGTAVDETESVEMRELGRSDDGADSNERAEEAEPLQPENTAEEVPRTHLSDILDSGNGVLGEYHLLHSIRSATMDLEGTAAHSLRTISYSATMAAIEARRQSQRAARTQGPQIIS